MVVTPFVVVGVCSARLVVGCSTEVAGEVVVVCCSEAGVSLTVVGDSVVSTCRVVVVASGGNVVVVVVSGGCVVVGGLKVIVRTPAADREIQVPSSSVSK